MDQGKIVEQGAHTELVAANGLYARLARLQFEGRPDSRGLLCGTGVLSQ
jgi:ABC-type transport system involved in cytochrome bd biosynthesis fused ATPase/permease subunit